MHMEPVPPAPLVLPLAQPRRSQRLPKRRGRHPLAAALVGDGEVVDGFYVVSTAEALHRRDEAFRAGVEQVLRLGAAGALAPVLGGEKLGGGEAGGFTEGDEPW